MAGTEAIFFQLTILLVLATLSHFTIKRFHQPTIVGEIALGILLGPSILGFYVGATLTATSTAIAASVLLDLGLMREPVAQTIMGAAVVDDILSLIVLSIVIGTTHGQINPVSIAVLLGTALAFLAVGMAVGLYFFRKVIVRIQVEGMRLGLKHGGFIIAMAVTFLYAFVAEVIGLSAVVGAFLAGSLFSTTPLRDDFTEGAGYLGAVFTPIFFISLGLQANLPLAGGSPALLIFAAVLTVAAILTKVVGCGIPARLLRMTRHESESVGWGMTPRGEVGLIVALSALTAGVIQESLYSINVVVMTFVSILPAPLFKRPLAAVDADRRRAKEASSAAPP